MIYLDHAAATPVSEKVFEEMEPYFREEFFNPSAPYMAAKKVRDVYENAKDRIGHVIGAKGDDLVITGSATEANNLAMTVAGEGKILYLETEHDSVRQAAGGRGVPIRVLKSGVIDLNDLQEKICDIDAKLVSVSLVNNETGVIQPVAEIAEIIRSVRRERSVYLHVDASQAVALMDISVGRLGADLLTISSAKIYGPKGAAALFVSRDVRGLKPLVYGGGQENGMRAGTENVAAVVGFARAAEMVKEHINSNRKKYESFSKIFAEILKTAKVEPVFIGGKKKLANFLSVSFPGIDAERIIYILEEKEIYVSTGAACAASKGEKSHVLAAMGYSDEEINGSLRITFGATNDEAQIREAATEIVRAVNTEWERMQK